MKQEQCEESVLAESKGSWCASVVHAKCRLSI